VAGNGEWVAYASDPANTAIGGEIFQDGFESGNTSAWSQTVGAE
jgi:hypothetical protein